MRRISILVGRETRMQEISFLEDSETNLIPDLVKSRSSNKNKGTLADKVKTLMDTNGETITVSNQEYIQKDVFKNALKVGSDLKNQF